MIVFDVVTIVTSSCMLLISIGMFFRSENLLDEVKEQQRKLLTIQMEEELFPQQKQITPPRKYIHSYTVFGREVYRREEQ